MQQLAAQIPRFHNCVVLDKVKDRDARLFYLSQAAEQGWSRDVLVLQIKRSLHLRQSQAVSNFERTLPAPGSRETPGTLRDPRKIFCDYRG